MSRFSLATAALATAACLSAPAFAADLYGGSVKDGPVLMSSPGHCYIRGDVGYSWSQDPSASFTQTTPPVFVTNRVGGTSLDNAWLVGGGVGCGSGPRGIRGELMLDWRGDRNLSGTLALPSGAGMSTSVRSFSVMFNGYYDLVNIRGFVPYVGAGVGLAHNQLGRVTFVNDPALANPLNGDDRWSLAWSLMTGVGYQLSDRVTLDLGYRYIDLGRAQSSTVDSTGFASNPRVRIDDIAAHEFKVGLRFAFGGGEPCCAMMK